MKRWERVIRTVRCMFGHDIPHPEWALFLKHGAACCEQHAYEYYKLVPTTYTDGAA